jgi:tRNA acetyltransferase TAN1
MLKDFNILGTTSRGNEREAISELRYLLEQVGDTSPTITRTGASGLIVAKTQLDPLEVIERFRGILHERPYQFRFMLRVMPIERVVRTDVEEIKRVVAELATGLGENETFRVTVEKRFTTTSSRDIIEAAAKTVQRRVNLDKPDKVVLIEVIGSFTGISVLKPELVISVLKEKLM